MPSPYKPGPAPPTVIAIDVESQQAVPAGTLYKGHHHRDTYDGDLVPRPCGELSASSMLGGNMKVTFKVRALRCGCRGHDKGGPSMLSFLAVQVPQCGFCIMHGISEGLLREFRALTAGLKQMCLEVFHCARDTCPSMHPQTSAVMSAHVLCS